MRSRTAWLLVVGLIQGALPGISPAESPAPQAVKVAAAQLLTDTHQLDTNQRKIMAAMREASQLGCQVVLFHEGCLTGYPNGQQVEQIDFAAVRAAECEIRDLAKQLRLAVLLGSTGLLRQQVDGRIIRELAWGTITAGRVQGSSARPGYAAGAGD